MFMDEEPGQQSFECHPPPQPLQISALRLRQRGQPGFESNAESLWRLIGPDHGVVSPVVANA